MSDNTAVVPATRRGWWRGAPVGAAAALIGLIYGYDNGSIASAALFLKPELHLSTLELSVVVSAVSFGTLVGAIVGSTVADRFGRRKTLIAVAAGYLVFSGVQAAAFNVAELTVIRALLGVAIGLSIVAAPAFLAETTPTRIRGTMLVCFNFAQTIGLTSSYFIGTAIASTGNWRAILGLAAIPSLVALLVVLRLPESPRWYLMKNRVEDARSVLSRIYPAGEAERELGIIRDDLTKDTGRFREVFQGKMRIAGVFAVVMGFSVQITGIPAIVQYSPTVLQGLGFTSPSAALLAVGAVQAVGVLVEACALLVIDRWGRRPVILAGMGVMGVGHLCFVAAFATGAPVMGVVGLLVFIIGFNFGYGTLVFVYAAEALPSRLRAHGATTLLTADLVANLAISFIFLNVMNAVGGVAVFAGFAVLTVLAWVFIFRFAPETKRRRLEDIRIYWLHGARWPQNAIAGRQETAEGPVTTA